MPDRETDCIGWLLQGDVAIQYQAQQEAISAREARTTMRSEWEEFNPWQVSMGQATTAVLEASGVVVFRVQTAVDLIPTLSGALGLAFQSRCRVAVLLSQQFLGAKQFVGGGS